MEMYNELLPVQGKPQLLYVLVQDTKLQGDLHLPPEVFSMVARRRKGALTSYVHVLKAGS